MAGCRPWIEALVIAALVVAAPYSRAAAPHPSLHRVQLARPVARRVERPAGARIDGTMSIRGFSSRQGAARIGGPQGAGNRLGIRGAAAIDGTTMRTRRPR